MLSTRARSRFDTWAAWGLILYLGAITALYARLAFPAVFGATVPWRQAAAVALVGAVAVALWRGPRAKVAAALCGAMLAAGVAMVAASGQLVAALIALWLLALGWAWADWLLRKLGAEPAGASLERLGIALPLGLALLCLLGLALALAGQLAPWRVWTALAVLTAVRWRSFRPALARARAAPARISDWLRSPFPFSRAVPVALLFATGLLGLIWALTPEVQFDALHYHLAVPKAWIAAGRLVDVPLFIHSYLVRLVNMLYTLGLALHGPMVAKLLVFAMGIVTTLGAYVLGRRAFDERAGLWAAALFSATPLVLWLSATAYTDLSLAMFLQACLLAYLRWRSTRGTAWFWASALLAGAAVGTKVNLLYALAALVPLLARDLRRTSSGPSRGWLGKLAAWLLLVGIVSAPMYILTWIATGNPCFPFLNHVFRSPLMPPYDLEAALSKLWGVGTSPGALLRLPWALTWQTRLFGEVLPDGGLGLTLAVLPLTVLLVARNATLRCLLAVVATYGAIVSLTFQYARFYVPVLPLVSVLVAGLCAGALASPWQRRLGLALASLALVSQVAVAPRLFWNVPERLPWRLAFGLQSRQEFLRQALRPYAAVQYLNGALQPGEKVLGLGAANVRFYLEAPLGVPNISPALDGLLKTANTEAALRDRLEEAGYVYLLVTESAEARERTVAPLHDAFLARFATLAYSENGFSVYRLLPASP